MKRFFVGFAGLALLGTSPIAAQDKTEATAFEVSADDPEMNAARERALATLPDFFRRLAAPAADESRFMIKFDILPGGPAEFVWAVDLDRSTAPMTGILVNQPVDGDRRVGERVPIAEADIVDWAYFRGPVLQGGFTNRVLVDRMPPDEAASYRATFGW